MEELFERGTLIISKFGLKAELIDYEELSDNMRARLFLDIYADEYDRALSFTISVNDLIDWQSVEDVNFKPHNISNSRK